MPTNLVTIDQSGAPAGLLASTSLATIDQPLPPPAILGWNYQGRVVGAGELARITWKGIFKASAATVVAAGATAVRGRAIQNRPDGSGLLGGPDAGALASKVHGRPASAAKRI